MTIFAAGLVSVAALKLMPLPFAWIGACWALAMFGIGAAIREPWRILAISLGAALCALCLAELFLATTRLEEIQRTSSPALNDDHPILGWTPKPEQITRARASIGDEVIYDVRYTTDSLGHRIAPAATDNPQQGCLIFFADSFTFGEGVEDNEAFPFVVGEKTDGEFRIVNLAAPGYGAEHMLAILQNVENGASLPCLPTHVFYAALPHHVHRAAGKTDYAARGPRYQLGPGDSVVYAGTSTPPNDPDSSWMEWLKWQASKSAVWTNLSRLPPRTTDEDLKLYYAIVREAFDISRLLWPNAERHLISWDIHSQFALGQSAFHANLQTVDAELHFIDDILPGYSQNPVPYGLHARDLHPNATAHQRVADYIVQSILGP